MDSISHIVINKQKTSTNSVQFNLVHAFPSIFNDGQYQECDWFADSASTEHMTGLRHFLSSFVSVTHEWNVKGVGTEPQPLTVTRKGNIKIEFKIGNDVRYGTLQDVIYVPGIDVNLFSIGKATDRGIKAIFEKEICHSLPQRHPRTNWYSN